MPDPRKILATIRRASGLMRSTPGRIGSMVRLDERAEDVLVAGDLHGHVHVFASLLKLAALDSRPRRHLVLQEPTHDTRVDPDEGEIDRSHRLIDLICALKCQYPDRVHLILGNHELSELTGRSISKKGFALNSLFRQGVEAGYGEAADEVIAAYHDLFRALPLAIRTPNRVLMVHTIPDAADLDSLDPAFLLAEEWPPESTRRGGPVYALTWGRDLSAETADRFAGLVDADLFLIGHHACESGQANPNPRTVVLDGTDPHPSACLFPAKGPVDLSTLLAGIRVVPSATSRNGPP
jgi:hypothetical protein